MGNVLARRFTDTVSLRNTSFIMILDIGTFLDRVNACFVAMTLAISLSGPHRSNDTTSRVGR